MEQALLDKVDAQASTANTPEEVTVATLPAYCQRVAATLRDAATRFEQITPGAPAQAWWETVTLLLTATISSRDINECHLAWLKDHAYDVAYGLAKPQHDSLRDLRAAAHRLATVAREQRRGLEAVAPR
jgi:hypothetical protein